MRAGISFSLVIMLASLASSASAQDTYFVNAGLATGNNDGSSWTDAFQGPGGVQAALAQAVAGDQVWIAAGTYPPTAGADRTASFEPADGVSLYGGFAGTESSLGDRDPVTNVTTLSGDLNGDDGPDFQNRSDNAYNIVVVTDGNVVLDGMTFSGANGSDNPDNQVGGGGVLVEFQAGVDITQCDFIGNEAYHGAGLDIRGAAHLERCRFIGNRATGSFGIGGAATSFVGFASENATFTNCLFVGNRATIGGGAVGADHSGLMMNNCTVVGNETTEGTFGGGVMMQGTFGTLHIANTIIWGNVTTDGSSDELTQLWNPNLNDFLVLNHSTVQGFTGTRIFLGSGNSNTAPSFVDDLGGDGMPATGDEDYKLGLTSPLIDAGNNALVPAGVVTDLEGQPRFVDVSATPDTGSGSAPIVDLGAFESQGGPAAVPAVGSWGLLAAVLCLLSAATHVFRRTALPVSPVTSTRSPRSTT